MKLDKSSLVYGLGLLLSAAPALSAIDASFNTLFTAKHEAGRCALRGQCGAQGFFGGELPCVNNTLAQDPDESLRTKLVQVCGAQWANGPVCCDDAQLEALQTNLKRADAFISSCPACEHNFHNLFCTFTCSPDQSLFINVTKAENNTENKLRSTELDNLWSDRYASIFYDSCKDVKFGAANMPAMNLIGGAAKNFPEFLHFLGEKKFLGSPFQINFPRPDNKTFPGMKPANASALPCNTTDVNYKCTCVDCASSCADLPEIKADQTCRVGHWTCISFAAVLIYTLLLFLMILAVGGHVAYMKHAQNKHERLRLLQDTSITDDEDEDGEIVYQPGVLSRPTRKYSLNSLCDSIFTRLGYVCARFPAITISISVVVVGLLSLGWLRFAVETDPVKLWVAPDSEAAQEKTFFDQNFGPFFRAEQAFLVNDTNPSGPGPILTYDNLRWWRDVENRVSRLRSPEYGVSFSDICYNPTGDACVLQSWTGYFAQAPSQFSPSEWQAQIQKCAITPSLVECLPAFKNPLNPKMVFGGYNSSVKETEALIVTWVVKNHNEGTEEVKRAIDWENTLKNHLIEVQIEAKERGLRLSFNTEISLEQELNKSSNTDAKIVAISYIVMFIYASIALGSNAVGFSTVFHNPASALIQSKFMLGIVGIVIVLFSVSASVGLFSAAGIKVTLIIAEVIPFLVLAVGVDNIFLIVHEFERVNASHPDEFVEDRVARALGRMGPSILLSATMETVAFALGALAGMPAVRNFAIYAAGAVLINAILQITMFVSVLALNQRRVESGRIDCIPCIRADRSAGGPDGNQIYVLQDEDALQRFIRRKYAPALMGKKMKVFIVTIFLGLFAAGVALLPTIELGLDQRIAIPEDSYLIAYFNDLYDYFSVGSPVYFVTREANFTERSHQQEICGRFPSCETFSLANILEQESKRPEVSYIAEPTANWLDDYFLYLDPARDKCCVDPNTGKACFDGRDPPWNRTLYGMPQGEEFIKYLSRWQKTPTNEDCTLGGKAAYSDALVFNETSVTIEASHFRTFHSALHSQKDFIASYAAARRISKDIESHNPGISVFPYSKHYVFFDPYATIVKLTFTLLGSAVVVCFVISSILLGSVRTGFVVSVTVIMTLVDIGGAMALAGVNLNPLTVVNLLICVGIAVEFCAHVARAFQFPSSRLLERGVGSSLGISTPGASVAPFLRGANRHTAATSTSSFAGSGARYNQPNFFHAALHKLTPSTPTTPLRGRDARAWAALSQVGGSVFSGITVTKLLGVCVLAFTQSKIFEIYYFRVWLALVVFAALHALIWLPVALSLLGGPNGYIDAEADGGIEEDLLSRRTRGINGGAEGAGAAAAGIHGRNAHRGGPNAAGGGAYRYRDGEYDSDDEY